MASRSYHLTMRFDAPLSYTYKWCTDYREDDYKISGESSRKHIVEASSKRYAWIAYTEGNGKRVEKIRLVTLTPPRKWHLDGYGDEYNIEGDYFLKKLGPRKTELRMSFTLQYKTIPPEPREEFMSDLKEEWEIYRKALENDYSSER